jgi:hypothetical protein
MSGAGYPALVCYVERIPVLYSLEEFDGLPSPK